MMTLPETGASESADDMKEVADVRMVELAAYTNFSKEWRTVIRKPYE